MSAREYKRDRRVDCYVKRGWCPVPWAHHPEPIKRAIRAMGWRPQMKQCFANSQRFALYADRHGIEVEYREGYASGLIPFEHAWLMFEGRVLDLTIEPDGAVEYLKSYAVPTATILQHVVRTETFSPIDPRRLWQCNPFAKSFEQLRELHDAGAL